MRSERFGKLRVHLTGGADREGGGAGPLVVMLHGFGAPGTDLVGLWRQLAVPRAIRFAFVEAPHLVDVGMPAAEARAWWMIDMLALQTAVATQQFDALAAHRPPGLDQARVLLEATLDELERALGVPEGKLVLGGFSQGAMLGTDLALTTDRKLAGLIVMSGTLLDEKHWVAAMTGRRGLPVLISHGKSDPLLPYQLAERLRDRMTAAGLGVEFIAFNGGHGIADSVLTALGHFLARVLT